MFADVFCYEEFDWFSELLVVIETAVGCASLQGCSVLLCHGEERLHRSQLTHEEDVLEEANRRLVEGCKLKKNTAHCMNIDHVIVVTSNVVFVGNGTTGHLLVSRFSDDVNLAPDFRSGDECDLVEHVLKLGVQSALKKKQHPLVG